MAKERPRVDIDFDDLFVQANEHQTTRGAVAGRASRIAKRARMIDQRDGNGTATISVRERHMPNGRAAYDVVSDDPSSEYGTDGVRRIRALRRAAREVRR